MIFHDYTLRADGQIQSHREQDTAKLEPIAVEIFRSMLQAGANFTAAIPHPQFAHIELIWTAIGGNAMATFKSRGELVTSSVLLSSRDPVGEAQFLQQLDQMLAAIGGGPAGLQVVDRPLIVSIPWPAGSPDMGIVADMETCLAAAWFS